MIDALREVLIEVGRSPRDEVLQRNGALIDSAFQDWLAAVHAGRREESETYLKLFLDLLPASPNVLSVGMAMACTGEDLDRAAFFAQRLLPLGPDNVPVRIVLADHCRRTGDVDAEVEHRLFLASPKGGLDERERSRHLYEAANVILSHPLTPAREARLAESLNAHEHLCAEGGGDAWAAFHQAMMATIDLDSLARPDDGTALDPVRLCGADGTVWPAESWAREWAAEGVEALFCVAADPIYCRRYAGLFARSVLRHAGVECRVVVHVIGAGADLPDIVGSLAIDDPRVVYSGDDFDSAQVSGRVVDSPTRAPIDKPIGHYQSARFGLVAPLLDVFGVPLFLTDIDCILQRGVGDLLDSARTWDLMLNENGGVTQFGAQLTANLLLFQPTPASHLFARFLRRYLATALQRPLIPKWVDQIGLGLARHYLRRHMPSARIGTFDVASDINNVVYPAYVPTPYRFLSLYQGFDLASLPDPEGLR